MAGVEVKVFPIEVLRDFSTRIFLHFGVPKADAEQAADVLASADLRGIDSHGVAGFDTFFSFFCGRPPYSTRPTKNFSSSARRLPPASRNALFWVRLLCAFCIN